MPQPTARKHVETDERSPAARAANAMLHLSDIDTVHVRPKRSDSTVTPAHVNPVVARTEQRLADLNATTLANHAETVESKLVRPKLPRSDYLTKLTGSSGRRVLGEDEMAHVRDHAARGLHPIAIADALHTAFPDRPFVSPAAIKRAVKYKTLGATSEQHEYALHLAARGYHPDAIRVALADRFPGFKVPKRLTVAG